MFLSYAFRSRIEKKRQNIVFAFVTRFFSSCDSNKEEFSSKAVFAQKILHDAKSEPLKTSFAKKIF